MAKQDNPSFEKTTKSGDKKDSRRQSGTHDSSTTPVANLDSESEFAVNELREEKRDSE